MTSESGAIVERVEYDAYGEPRVFGGIASSGAEGAAPLAFSGVGNPYLHQGLRRDDESGLHENRYRSLHSRLGRFMQRDPLGYASGMSLFTLDDCDPIALVDPLGLDPVYHHPYALGVGGDPGQPLVALDHEQHMAAHKVLPKYGVDPVANKNAGEVWKRLTLKKQIEIIKESLEKAGFPDNSALAIAKAATKNATPGSSKSSKRKKPSKAQKSHALKPGKSPKLVSQSLKMLNGAFFIVLVANVCVATANGQNVVCSVVELVPIDMETVIAGQDAITAAFDDAWWDLVDQKRNSVVNGFRSNCRTGDERGVDDIIDELYPESTVR